MNENMNEQISQNVNPDMISSQAGLASFEQTPTTQDAAAMMQAAAEQPPVIPVDNAQEASTAAIITEVPGFSNEAEVVELPTPVQDASATELPATEEVAAVLPFTAPNQNTVITEEQVPLVAQSTDVPVADSNPVTPTIITPDQVPTELQQ